MHDRQIKRLVLSGILAAIVIVLTALVSVPLPGGHGYINLGDAGVLTAAYVLGGAWGALCAGIASGLSDVLLGWGIYAPATFIIKGGMAFFAAYLMKKRSGGLRAWTVYLAALLVPLGYLLFETVLYGTAAALPNVPLNLAQCFAGAAIAHAVIAVLDGKGLVSKFLPDYGAKPRSAAAAVADPVVLREPKGGPDVILIGCEAETDTLTRAANSLSVRGYTARIVQLAPGAELENLNPRQRETVLSGGAPFVRIATCSKEHPSNAEDLIKTALEAMNK